MDPHIRDDLSTIALELMPQQLAAKSLHDDWTGVTSTEERKRRQNRLHQRAYRNRKRAAFASLPASKHVAGVKDGVVEVKRKMATGFRNLPPEGHLLLPTPESRKEVQRFAQRAYDDYNHGAPRLEHLNILIRLNVLNAISYNAALIGFRFQGLCCPELISPFNTRCPSLPHEESGPPSFPDWLRPTALQISVKHHPWIDLIPFPAMRDNILRALDAGVIDTKELGIDILNVEGKGSNAASMIVWGDAWDPQGWEASGPFLQKWGWLMEGCTVLLEATNSWRQSRGERRIPVGLFS